MRHHLVIALAMLASCVIATPAYPVTAFTPQFQPIGSVGQEVLTNSTLTSDHETLFRTEYEKEFWGGNLYAFPISATGVLNTDAERWSGGAAVHIEAQNFSSGRFIGTLRDNGLKVPFLSASLSVAQQGALASTVNTTAYSSTQIVNYLRGDHNLESSTQLRPRLSRQGSSTIPTSLGDIIHSKVYYLADATNPTLFVGANDGMLHAINSSDGSERWAYVPSMLLTKMNKLASYPYVHDYFVDGQLAVGNISCASGNCRILVGALGAGGKGLYALNIDGASGLTATSDQQAADKILWEITPTQLNYATPQNNDSSTNATAYSNLGFSYGVPQLKTINNAGSPLRVVIIGNGYNNGGDYQAYLYVINAADGKLVRAIKADSNATNTTGVAVSNGTATSPNGLYNILAFDSNNDGYTDRVYAGDLNGALWKFDLSSATPASWSALVLQVTNPKQPITASPAAMPHPSGIGYMVNFGTGSIFSGTQPTSGVGATGDLGDTATFYVYGIWDSAPASNSTLTAPVLTERCYNTAGVPGALPCPDSQTRVRRVSFVTPNWASGGNKGWKVALPTGGERLTGEGSFISSGRYYFTTYNPTLSYLVPTTSTYLWGENWQMALESLSGGSVDPFMDLNGDGLITIADRIKYTATDATVIAGTQMVNTPVIAPNVDGIEVGKWVSRGVQSQPVLVKLSNLFTTLFNNNPDVTFAIPQAVGTGVDGGHFDQDIYFGAISNSTQASATVTVGSTGNTLPATLGGIQVEGMTIIPALSIADLPSGAATANNAATLVSKTGSGIYTATVSGSTITLKAPAGADYNGKTLTIVSGNSSVIPASSPASGNLVFTAVDKKKTISLKCGNSFIGRATSWTSSNDGTASTRLNELYSSIDATTVNGYTIACARIPNTTTPTTVMCAIAAPAGVSACSDGFTVDSNISTSTNTGPVGGTAVSGWSDLAPALSTTSFSGGANGSTAGDTCTSGCQKDTHIHQYDNIYDVTGVNMLNASSISFNLDRAIPSTAQNFKVLLQNQYLNPAVKLNIGDINYLPYVDFGYIRIKNYLTSATIDMAAVPTYNRNPASTGDGLTTGPKYIGSLTINMPIDALGSKNWWGNGDVRPGLMPSTPGCVNAAASANDGNLYQPVRAPANDATLGYPLDGPGTKGWSTVAPVTTPATATGVRHGGALTVQLIRDNTPNSALELNDHLGRPEYGWRVKAANYSSYVLAEYTTYWHHPNNACFYAANWTKNPGADNGTSAASTKAAGSTDPKIGTLGGGSGGTVSSVVIAGDVTTINYNDGSKDVIQRIVNANLTVTTITTHFAAGISGAITNVINLDNSISTLISKSDGTSLSGTAISGSFVTLSDGTTASNTTTANASSSNRSGGLLNQNAIGYKRIFWKELFRN